MPNILKVLNPLFLDDLREQLEEAGDSRQKLRNLRKRLPPSSGLFTELRAHNGCLNRKVSIRADGQICNCPSLQSTYGKDLNKLHEIVASSAFQRAWHLKKDLFEVCSGCEFRYVCTDCRAHLGSDESLGKPALCGYDPASGSWGASSRTRALSGSAVDRRPMMRA